MDTFNPKLSSAGVSGFKACALRVGNAIGNLCEGARQELHLVGFGNKMMAESMNSDKPYSDGGTKCAFPFFRISQSGKTSTVVYHGLYCTARSSL